MRRSSIRLASLLLVIIIVITCTVPAFARFKEIAQASCGVSISSNGYATSTAMCSTWDTKSKIVMTVQLLQSEDGKSWTNYHNYGSATGYGDLNRSLGIYVYKNYYYRTYFYVNIYDSNGNWIESEVFESTAKWYS